MQQSSENIVRLSSYIGKYIDAKYLGFISENNYQVKKMYRNILSEHLDNSGIENAFLFNKSLNILVAVNSTISETQLQLNRLEILNLNNGQSIASYPFSDKQGRWYIWGFYKIKDGYYLGIEEKASRLNTLNELASTFLMIGFIGVLLIVIAALIIANSISKPVKMLVEFSNQIGRGNFEAKPPGKIYGEFEVLKTTMEQMKNDLSLKNQEREQMLAQIAHEIRNPLGGIELLTGLVKEDINKEGSSEKHIIKIQDEIKRLKEQLTLFLDYSKPLKAEKKKVVIEPLILDLKKNYVENSKDKKIRLNYEASLKQVDFDENQLKQILTNLITNSVDSIGKTGIINIKSYHKNGRKIISISDNGPGVKKDDMLKVFTPFFTTKANGTGLGLAISKKLCAINSASLEFENLNPAGAMFKIVI